MALLSNLYGKFPAIEMSLFPSKIDTKEWIGINLAFLYGQKYPVIASDYDGTGYYEIEIILDNIFEFLVSTKDFKDDVGLYTLDDDFTINIYRHESGQYKVQGFMDTPSIEFFTTRKDIVAFMLSLAKEFRKYCPQGKLSMIETTMKILDIVKDKKGKKSISITKAEWKTFCLYALYIDETGIIPKTGSFKALAKLKKSINAKLMLKK